MTYICQLCLCRTPLPPISLSALRHAAPVTVRRDTPLIPLEFSLQNAVFDTRTAANPISIESTLAGCVHALIHKHTHTHTHTSRCRDTGVCVWEGQSCCVTACIRITYAVYVVIVSGVLALTDVLTLDSTWTCAHNP